ncbi:hypothetical protein G6011_07713 [Alternaria panax]|uniref:Uncharacterized protein n=1 Tax=Alternaria panax TaxID=48097 RepID=A0AAD4F7E4_9PLEO|nr:hypothetical protein G6011_07713 [Alternaria panax]
MLSTARCGVACLTTSIGFCWAVQIRKGGYRIRYDKHRKNEEDNEDEKKDKVSKNGYKKMPGGAGAMFLSRLWWAIRLTTATRYTGWSNQVKNMYMEVPADYALLTFIARKTLRALIFYVPRDMIASYTADSPYGFWVDIRTLKPFQTFPPSSPFLARFWYTWVHILLTMVTMEMANSVFGVVSVATHLANPRDCPFSIRQVKRLV